MSTRRRSYLRGARLRRSGLPIWITVLLAVAVVQGCQTGAPPTGAATTSAPPRAESESAKKVEEARPAASPASSNAFVPPPRTISDITAILDQQKRDRPGVEAADRQRAEQAPPGTKDPAALARFYWERAGAALKVGRSRQAIDDFTQAAEQVARAPETRGLEMQIRWSLYGAETQAGSYTRAVAGLERARERASPGQRGWLFNIDSDLVQHYVFVGRLDAAEAMRREVTQLREEARQWRNLPPAATIARWDARVAQAQALMLEGRGRYAEAEPFGRRSITLVENTTAARRDERDPTVSTSDLIDLYRARLSRLLMLQGRMLEAEVEARRALLSALRKYGRYSTWTAHIGRWLTLVLLSEGRYAETETLARAMMEIYEKTGASEESSLNVSSPRQFLAAALLFQGRWAEALREYDILQTLLRDEPLAGWLRSDPNFSLALIKGGRAQQAARELTAIIDSREQQLAAVRSQQQASRNIGAPDTRAPSTVPGGRGGGGRGAGNRVTSAGSDASSPGSTGATPHAATPEVNREEIGRSTAEFRALRAMASAAQGDSSAALAEFAKSVPILLNRSLEIDEETGAHAMVDDRLSMILTAYIGLLADVAGTPRGRQAGIDAAAEAFRLADVARGRQVQRALDESAARASATSPALAELVRQEQDARKEVSALNGHLSNQLSLPSGEQDPDAISDLRARLADLQQGRRALNARISREFPAYSQLVNPPPVTVEQVRAVLRPGEAVLSIYSAETRTFVWAVPRTGSVAYAGVPIGERALAAAVAELRRSLDANAATVDDIPPFDVQRAHEIYRLLLEPVAPGWQTATSLLVIAHGPIGELPFGLLVTKDAPLPPDQGALFSRYRATSWLIRTHAVTVLPSVTSLVTLRALPTRDTTRRPFVGFGDPYFSEQQARRAAANAATAPEPSPLATRGAALIRRSAPRAEGTASSTLADLPPLPETAEEIRSIARAVHADLAKDVFLGERANEQVVKSVDLAAYRVIAFATHGLVPGELDGLTQPALALTAPAVAKVNGDGLLTMEKILALRLNADWVVLSACNTAAGNGAGSEAVSGLGRAFFYAGARALLVSNWPVETTSAKALTTELFRRQEAEPGSTRAEALQRTMGWLIDGPGFTDPRTGREIYTYAHPLFWAPFTIVGDSGAASSAR